MADPHICHYCGNAFTPPALRADLDRNAVVIHGVPYKAHARAVEVFSVLSDAFPRVICLSDLCAMIWGTGAGNVNDLNTLRSHIHDLRGVLAGTGWCVRNVYNQGYCLAEVPS